MLNDKAVDAIKQKVESFIRSQDIENIVLRDEIFPLLQKQKCVVLYYPIGDPTREKFCDGCNTTRTINGEQVHMVFINTQNTVERQVFTAAHELGHILRIAEDSANRKKIDQDSIEEATNRFAAELMMPRKSFIMQVKKFLSDNRLNTKRISMKNFLRLVVYLMEYFFMPFRAVLLRIYEMKFIDSTAMENALQYKKSLEIDNIIKEEQYTRLRQVNKRKSMSNLPEYLQKMQKMGRGNTVKIENICRMFDVENILKTDDLSQEISIRRDTDVEKVCGN